MLRLLIYDPILDYDAILDTSARNKIRLIQQLHVYTDQDIGAATSHKSAGHLWYLSVDLILLSLYDLDMEFTTKHKIVLDHQIRNEKNRGTMELCPGGFGDMTTEDAS